MPTPPLTEAMAAQMHAIVAEHGSVLKASVALGINVNTVRKRYDAATRRFGMPDIRTSVPQMLAPPPAPPGFVVSSHSAQTAADGSVEREWTKSKPAPGEIYELLPGHAVKGESALVDGEGRVLARWIKTREGASAALVDALQDAFGAYAGMAAPVAPPTTAAADLLTLYPVADLHLGMYAWGPETGEDYDVEIASRRATESVDALVTQSRPSEHAVILVLGDYFHQNDQTNATPGHKHRLDVDGRWPKVYAAGCRVLIRIVERVKAKHASVRVVVIPGNHDPDSAVTLAVAMSLFYNADDRVTVDEGPSAIWYHRFGRVLLGATHGHTMKPDRMAMMLASDRPEDWGQCWHRHFFFGHVHHESAKEVGPVRVESFGTLASRDAYAHAGGYRSSRNMQAITFHMERGEIGRHRVNIAAPKPRRRVKAGKDV